MQECVRWEKDDIVECSSVSFCLGEEVFIYAICHLPIALYIALPLLTSYSGRGLFDKADITQKNENFIFKETWLHSLCIESLLATQEAWIQFLGYAILFIAFFKFLMIGFPKNLILKVQNELVLSLKYTPYL